MSDSPKVFSSLEEVKAAVGAELGPTEYIEIDQQRVNQFADATGDHQWIHVDVERAKSGPFGGTIAHGYLTLSLSSYFMPRLIRVDNISMGLNYGVNKVRFPAPVRVGSRLRARGQIASVEDVKGGIQVCIVITLEVEGQAKPACVIESLSRFLA
ncbi:MAG: MaoC family dehydratase [Myxococcales bacterium]|nr:MaoC family dehydratase [Myxococcales bacterium]